jgi:mannose-6-phosphate isomerase-like protein (cupin superfamily)
MSDKYKNGKVEVLEWNGPGFRPLVEYGDWLVALMNWELRFHPTGVGDIERHSETDEVFVLTHGRGVLFVVLEDEIQVFDMKPGILYNVTKNTWHSVIGTKDTTWLIVESNHTCSDNTYHRQLTKKEMNALQAQYPIWLKTIADA